MEIEHIGGMDVALDQGDALLCGGSTQLVVQGLAGQGEVPLKAALDPSIIALAHGTGGQHHIKQLGLVGVAAGEPMRMMLSTS